MDIMNGNSGGDPNDPNAVLSRSGRSGVSGANLSVRSKDTSKNPFENEDDAASPLFEVANGDELNMPPTYKPRSNSNPARESYSLESNVESGEGGEGDDDGRGDNPQYASMQELLDDENSRKLDPFDRRKNRRGCGSCCGTCVDGTFGAKKTKRRKFTLLMLACLLVLGAIVGVVVYFLVGRKGDDDNTTSEMKNVPPSPNTAPTREDNKPTPLPPTDGGDKLDLTLKLPTTSPAPSNPRVPTKSPAEEAPPRLADRCPDIEPTNEETKYVQIPYEYLVVVDGDKDVDDFVVTMENVLHQRLVAGRCSGAISGKRELRGLQNSMIRGLKLGEMESRELQQVSYRGFNSNPPDSVSNESCPDETLAALTEGQRCYRVSGGITAVVIAGEASEMTIRSDAGGYAEEVMGDPALREPLGVVQVTVVDSSDADVGGGDGSVISEGSGSPSAAPAAPTDPSLVSPMAGGTPEPSTGPNAIGGVPAGSVPTQSPSYDPPTVPTGSPNGIGVGIDSPTAPLNYTFDIADGNSTAGAGPTSSPVDTAVIVVGDNTTVGGGDGSPTFSPTLAPAGPGGAIASPTFGPAALSINGTGGDETTVVNSTGNGTETEAPDAVAANSTDGMTDDGNRTAAMANDTSPAMDDGTSDALPLPEISPTCPDSKDADEWEGPIYLNDGELTFNYAIVRDPSTTRGMLCGRLETPSESYVAFGISPGGTMEGGEAIVGLPDEGTVKKYYLNKDTRSVEEMEEGRQTLAFADITRVSIEEDAGADVDGDGGDGSFVDGVSQVIGSLGFGNRQDVGGVTIMTFGKYLGEDGEHEILVDAGANNTFLWAVGSTNNLGYHAARGSFEVGFDAGSSDSYAVVADSNGTAPSDPGVDATDGSVANETVANGTSSANTTDDKFVDIGVNSTVDANGTLNEGVPTGSPTLSTGPTTTASPSTKLATIDWPSIIIDVVSNSNATTDGSAAKNGTDDNNGNVTNWNNTSIAPPSPGDNASTVSSAATLDVLSAPYAVSLSIPGEAQLGRYGSAVAVSSDGSIVAVCAKDASNDALGLPNTGAVHLYSFDGATLTPLQVIYGTSSNAEFGNAVALSLDGSRMAVGSRSENAQTGAMRVYERDAATSAWSLMVGGVIAGRNPSERFGWAVSISHDGNVVAGGSPRGGSQGGGTLVTYKYNDGSDGVSAVGWTQHGSVVESSEAREAVGYSVSLSDTGSAMVVGSPQASSGSDDDEVLGVGKVAMYVMTGTEWQPSGLEWYGESDGSADGTSVAMSQDGTVVVVGGKGRSVLNSTSGEVITSSVGYCRIYKFQGSQWELEHSIAGQAVDERLGSSVAVSSDGSVAACGGVDGSNDDLVSGVVRLWNRSTLRESTIWPRGEGSNVGGAAFGTALALSGNGGYVVVGAPSWSDADAGASAGAIQVFRSGA